MKYTEIDVFSMSPPRADCLDKIEAMADTIKEHVLKIIYTPDDGYTVSRDGAGLSNQQCKQHYIGEIKDKLEKLANMNISKGAGLKQQVIHSKLLEGDSSCNLFVNSRLKELKELKERKGYTNLTNNVNKSSAASAIHDFLRVVSVFLENGIKTKGKVPIDIINLFETSAVATLGTTDFSRYKR